MQKTYLLAYSRGWRGERVGLALDIADAKLMSEEHAREWPQKYDPCSRAIPPSEWASQVDKELRVARERVRRLEALQAVAKSAE